MHFSRMNHLLVVIVLLGLLNKRCLTGRTKSYDTLQKLIFEGELSERSFDSNNTMISVGLYPFLFGVAIVLGCLCLLIIPFLVPMGENLDYTGYGSSDGGQSTYSSYSRYILNK